MTSAQLETLLQAESINFAYDKKQILDNVSITINPSDRILLLGANGAGKSTLLKLLSGLIDPQEGKIAYNDLPERRSNQMSYLGHDLQLYLDLTVKENLKFFASLWGGDWLKAMDYWSITECQNQAVKKLSQGQKKRVALAVSYLVDPRLSLLDEPSSNLDVLGADLLKSSLSKLCDESACIVASHDIKFFSDWCNRLLVLDDCVLSQYGKLSSKKIQEVYLEVLK